MRIGLFGGSGAHTIEEVVERARTAHAHGFDTFWLAQVMGLDAMTALAIVGREVPEIRLATAVVPIQGRHPLPLAISALTVADAVGPGRFTLGLGVTHPSVSENWFGVPYRGIVDMCGDVLVALEGFFSEQRRADVDSERFSVHASVAVRAEAPGIILAAMGPRMVRLAGTHTDGTLTWMSGPVSVKRVADQLREAAAAAGRPDPRVAVGIPVCVTDDVDATRVQMAKYMDMAANMPAYRRQLEIEGVEQPVDIAVIGDEDEVDRQLQRFVDAGTTELCANLVGSHDDVERTMQHLARRNRSAG